MQYHKVSLIAAIVLLTLQHCTNNIQQRDEDNPYELPEGLSLIEVDKENSFKWPEGIKMGLTLTFDDARHTQVDKGIPILDKYNVKGTFYVSPENMVERMDKWRQAVANLSEI
jgi:peptidoglycan/xylan/chitin deacetylase (PgdA/CDA1 family)